MQNAIVCQSCGMPLTGQMIDICVPLMEEEGMDKVEARQLLEKELTKLKRWIDEDTHSR